MSEEMRVPSYSDIFTMGHKALTELFSGDVVVEEKVDGSQFSFGRVGDTLLMRSKGKQLVVDAPEKMFQKAVDAVKALNLPDGLTFRGEYFQSPKHNTLAYARVPSSHIIIFDIDRGNQDYLTPFEKSLVAKSLGLETVPLLFQGRIESVDQIKALLPKESCLGGAEPEGIVIKNYSRFSADKKILMGKYVRPEFKEQNAVEWRKENPKSGDIIQTLIATYKNEARWAKSVQHLRDAGTLEQSPRDIAALMKEVEADILKECSGEIKDALFAWAWHQIARGAKAGLPEWYKNQLLEAAIPAGAAK